MTQAAAQVNMFEASSSTESWTLLLSQQQQISCRAAVMQPRSLDVGCARHGMSNSHLLLLQEAVMFFAGATPVQLALQRVPFGYGAG